MQEVFYPGDVGQPGKGEYAIVIDNAATIPMADIVLVNRLHQTGTSFYNYALSRDVVVNRILANELSGIRLDWIRLFVLVEKSALIPDRRPDFLGVEIKDITLDTDDFIARGNPCTVRRRNFVSRLVTGIEQEVSYWSGHVVGGCARVSTSLENARYLNEQENELLCARIGLHQPAPGRPSTPSKPSRPASPRNTLSSSNYH